MALLLARDDAGGQRNSGASPCFGVYAVDASDAAGASRYHSKALISRVYFVAERLPQHLGQAGVRLGVEKNNTHTTLKDADRQHLHAGRGQRGSHGPSLRLLPEQASTRLDSFVPSSRAPPPCIPELPALLTHYIEDATAGIGMHNAHRLTPNPTGWIKQYRSFFS